jgi:hypothetical protein
MAVKNQLRPDENQLDTSSSAIRLTSEEGIPTPTELRKEQGLDIAYAEQLLGSAKSALVKGRFFKALKFARSAKAAAEEARRLCDYTWNAIRAAERLLLELKSIGVTVADAEDVLDQAKLAVEDASYRKALGLVEQCNRILRRAQFVPFPLLEKDVTIKTIVGYDRGRVLYKIRIENNMDEPLGELCVIPWYASEEFTPDMEEQIVGDVPPRGSVDVTFNLVPKNPDWVIGGIPGKLIQGRDITIKTIFSCAYGDTVYKVRIENNRDIPIEDIHVRPLIPDALVPDEDEKVIDLLNPREYKTVVFQLRPRGLLKPIEAVPSAKVDLDAMADDIVYGYLDMKVEKPTVEMEIEVKAKEEVQVEVEPRAVVEVPAEERGVGFTVVDVESRLMAYAPDLTLPIEEVERVPPVIEAWETEAGETKLEDTKVEEKPSYVIAHGKEAEREEELKMIAVDHQIVVDTERRKKKVAEPSKEKKEPEPTEVKAEEAEAEVSEETAEVAWE